MVSTLLQAFCKDRDGMRERVCETLLPALCWRSSMLSPLATTFLTFSLAVSVT